MVPDTFRPVLTEQKESITETKADAALVFRTDLKIELGINSKIKIFEYQPVFRQEHCAGCCHLRASSQTLYSTRVVTVQLP